MLILHGFQLDSRGWILDVNPLPGIPESAFHCLSYVYSSFLFYILGSSSGERDKNQELSISSTSYSEGESSWAI